MSSSIQPDVDKNKSAAQPSPPAKPSPAKPSAAAKPPAPAVKPPAAAAKSPATTAKAAAGPTPKTPPAKPAATSPAAAKPAAAGPEPAKPAPPPPAASKQEETDDVAAGPSLASGMLKQTPAWAVSMILHIVVLLAMALIVSDPPKEEKPRLITSTPGEPTEEFEEFVEEQIEQPTDAQEVTDAVVMPESTTVEEVQVVSDASDLDAAPLSVELSDFGAETAASSDLLSTVGVIGGKAAGGLGGRTNPKMRAQLVASGGGTPQSEAAVEAALKWFIEHQMPDGGWSFNLAACPSCQGQCAHGGTFNDRCGATAMALLPFLGRGYTHMEGPYKQQLLAGLTYLATLTVQGQGKAYSGSGNLYSQGIAGIVLSESYAMTQDKRLAIPAQLALNFIMAAQDPVGGGWRYGPKQPGDTSAVGWQLMALKSGHMAYLQVSPLTIKKAVEFLNSVQIDEGSGYGYTGPGNGSATSAVGLLCRMYLGWKKDHPALQRGVERLAKSGPTKDLYFDYYATQIMHHMEGEVWIAWNNKMRDMLVNAQSKKGHETGSWYEGVDAGHGPHVGGRIYCTSLATMILEVYYRHLPIYGQQSVDEEFKE
jgi:hypothetical protein